MNATSKTVGDSDLNRWAGEAMQVYTDASGAPATLVVDGYRFACDCIGGVRVRSLTDGPRRASKRACAIAEWRYRKLLDLHTTAEWRASNAAMYAA